MADGRKLLRAGCNRDDLASLIKTTRRTNAMRHVRSRALRANAQLREFQHTVVRPAHALAALRWFTFRNAHNFKSLFQFQFVQRRPCRRLLLSLAGIAGFFGLANHCFWQAATIRFAQRMLRKLKENIFAQKWSQVHGIAHNGCFFLACKRY